MFVARFNMWTLAWLRSSQPSTSALWCSVKMCLSSAYPASCIEATLYDPRIPAYRILLYLEFISKYKIEHSLPVALNNSEYQLCKFWIVFHMSVIKNGSLFPQFGEEWQLDAVALLKEMLINRTVDVDIKVGLRSTYNGAF